MCSSDLRHRVGRYHVGVCTNTLCAVLGGDAIWSALTDRLGIGNDEVTPDGSISLERIECQAACTEAPCLQTNYRYSFRVTPESFDALVDDLRAGRLNDEIPAHGVVARVRQHIPADKGAGVHAPEDVKAAPPWLDGKAAL